MTTRIVQTKGRQLVIEVAGVRFPLTQTGDMIVSGVVTWLNGEGREHRFSVEGWSLYRAQALCELIDARMKKSNAPPPTPSASDFGATKPANAVVRKAMDEAKEIVAPIQADIDAKVTAAYLIVRDRIEKAGAKYPSLNDTVVCESAFSRLAFEMTDNPDYGQVADYGPANDLLRTNGVNLDFVP